MEPVFTSTLRNYLAEHGFDPQMGARPMRRLIQDIVERPLAEAVLFGPLKNGGKVTVGFNRGKVQLKFPGSEAQGPKKQEAPAWRLFQTPDRKTPSEERTPLKRRFCAGGTAVLSGAGRTEAVRTAVRFAEFIHEFKLRLGNRDNHKLRDAVKGIDRESVPAPVPDGDHEFALVIRVNETDEIAEHDAVLMAEPRAGKNESGVAGIRDVHREPRVDEGGFTGIHGEGGIKKRLQVDSGRARRCGFRKMFFRPGVEHFESNTKHVYFLRPFAARLKVKRGPLSHGVSRMIPS